MAVIRLTAKTATRTALAADRLEVLLAENERLKAGMQMAVDDYEESELSVDLDDFEEGEK